MCSCKWQTDASMKVALKTCFVSTFDGAHLTGIAIVLVYFLRNGELFKNVAWDIMCILCTPTTFYLTFFS